MEKKIIFISSDSSFIGRELISYYKKKNFQIISFCKHNPSLKKKNYSRFDNFNDLKNYLKKIKKIHYLILNNGIIGNNHSFDKLIKSHYKNTISFLRLFKNIEVNRIIFFRTADESGYSIDPINEKSKIKPFNKYSLIKSLTLKLIKNYCNEKKVNYTFFKLFLVVGKKQKEPRLFAMIKNHIRSKKIFILNKPYYKKNFLHIDDFIFIFDKILSKNIYLNQTFNLASNQNITLYKLFKLINNYKKDFVYKISNDKNKKNQIPDISKLTKNIGQYNFKNIQYIIKDIL